MLSNESDIERQRKWRRARRTMTQTASRHAAWIVRVFASFRIAPRSE